MDCQEVIRTRRSNRSFDPKHEMSEREIKELIDLARLAPTSFNIQHARFLVVTDEDLREKIRAAAWGQAQVTDASILVVLCADLKAWSKDAARYWKDALPAARDTLVPMIGPFYEGKPELERDEAIRTVGLTAATLMLAAKSRGYDSSPMIGFDPQAVAELIGLPDDHLIGMLIAIGKTTAPAAPRPGLLPLDEVLIRNHF